MSSSKRKTLILSREDIQEITRSQGINQLMDELIQQLEEAMRTLSQAGLDIPARSGFNYKTPETGLIEWMPIYEAGGDVTIKVVGYHPNNPDLHDLPTIVSTISAYDTTTGHLLGIMDGVLPTALRTGAAAAIAAKYMAYDGSENVGMIGCGAQSITQVHGLSRIFDLKRIYIYDVSERAISSFSRRIEALDLDLEIIPAEIEKVVEQSDILVTATSIDVGAGPLFQGVQTKAHLHINAIGSDFPGKTELPIDLLKQSFICADFVDQALVEGECQQLTSTDIDADIIEVVTDPRKYKNVKNQRSVYDSTGWALQDKVTFALFRDLGRDLGMGQLVEIENMSGDTSNPYDFMRQSTPMELRELEMIKTQEG